MGNKSTTIRIGLLAATVVLLVGCSGTQGARTVQLPEPKDVPKEMVGCYACSDRHGDFRAA